MSVRQDLKLEIEDFLYDYKDKIVRHLVDYVIEDSVDCDDCGHEMYMDAGTLSSEAAEAILDIIARDIHSQEQLIHLTLAGDLAWNLLNGNNTVSPGAHKQYDAAMKGLS